jgi:TolB protein
LENVVSKTFKSLFGIVLGLFIGFNVAVYSEEIYLDNIRQLTFPSMGFEKAGEAYFSPDAKKIIFQAVPTGQHHYQIFTMDLEENIPRLVSTGKGACTCAYFKPDGSKIIFASSHNVPENYSTSKCPRGKYKWDLTPYMNIYEANVDGSNMVALTSGSAYHAECAYSADGTRIVYASNEDGHMNLYVMNSDGTGVEQITHTRDFYNGGPFFSPNGKQIIYRADPSVPEYLQIYLLSTDGSNLQQLTDNGAVNWAPYWHPEGKVIAFTTSLLGHHLYQVFLLNVETGVQERLTQGQNFDGLPVFSNDGKKLLWTSKRGPDNTCQIFIADFKMPLQLN